MLSIHYCFIFPDFVSCRLWDGNISFSGGSIHIGFSAKQKLRQLLSAGDVSDGQAQIFYRNITIYFEVVSQYLLQKLPIHYAFLQEIQWIDPEKQNGNVDAMLAFATR